MKSISMRDLQKISARTIQSLPHAVPIKSGAVTIGVLLPLRRSNQDGLRRLLDQVDKASAGLYSRADGSRRGHRAREENQLTVAVNVGSSRGPSPDLVMDANMALGILLGRRSWSNANLIDGLAGAKLDSNEWS